jgi:16S rRNA (adenine1518-N6/adenine1519-N6)-dimethyltransferase
MKLSEIKTVLAGRGIRLTKSLGQNFLHDLHYRRRVVGMAELTAQDRVLEIGPGLGSLTELLLEEANSVVAIEKDQRLVEFLRERFQSCSRLTLLHGDALRYLEEHRADWSGWKVVSNLPYSVGSRILVELAGIGPGPARLVVTLQMEVAQRLLAEAGADDYGALTLLVRLKYEPAGWFRVPATCFFPAPEVASACVCLARRAALLLPPEFEPSFRQLIRTAFSQRRKMMFKLLKGAWPGGSLAATFDKAGLDQRVRAETVSLEQFVALAKAMAR